jgi:hypothetical protein
LPKIPDGLRPDLAEAVAQEIVTFSYKKSWQVANQTLRSSEKVIAATKARRFPSGDRGVPADHQGGLPRGPVE